MPDFHHWTLLLVLFLLSAFFSGAETALFSLSKIERRRLKEKHSSLAKWVETHLEHPRRTLITILIGNLFVNTLSAAMAAIMVMESWGVRFLGLGMLVYTLTLIFFSEILPKVLAVRSNELASVLFAVPLRFFEIIFTPLRYGVTKISDWLLARLGHERKHTVHEISPEELNAFVVIGEEEGILDRDERQMIQKLFQLGKRPIKDIMTPRIDMKALNVNDPPEKNTQLMKQYHFSQFPVFEETRDNILGVVSVVEFMLDKTRDLRGHLKKPLFIPEAKRIDEVLEDFHGKSQHFAVCVDEHGGTAGIVTQEDVLEEIFGEYYDEYAAVENPVRRYSHSDFLVDAKIKLEDFNHFFSVHLRSDTVTTLGGYILEKLGEVPEKDKVLHLPGLDIRIHDVIRQRLKNVIVSPRHD